MITYARKVVPIIGLFAICLLAVGCNADAGAQEAGKPGQAQNDPDPLSKILKARQNGNGVAFTLAELKFEHESAEISDETLQTLAPLAEYLRGNPQHKIIIEGYTDDTGNYHFNLALSQERAEAVKAYLVEHEIDAERILTLGRGPNDPIASNDTEEGRQQNRRVEIVFVEAPITAEHPAASTAKDGSMKSAAPLGDTPKAESPEPKPAATEAPETGPAATEAPETRIEKTSKTDQSARTP